MNQYIREDIAKKLARLAKFRGITVQELLEQFLEEVDDLEQDEIGMYLDET